MQTQNEKKSIREAVIYRAHAFMIINCSFVYSRPSMAASTWTNLLDERIATDHHKIHNHRPAPPHDHVPRMQIPEPRIPGQQPIARFVRCGLANAPAGHGPV